MVIDLTDLMQRFEFKPIVLKIGGKHYDVEDLTIEQANKLDGFDKMSDLEGLDFIASLFGDHQPPQVKLLRDSLGRVDAESLATRKRCLQDIMFIVSAIRSAYVSHADPERFREAVEAMEERVRASYKATTEEPGSE